MDKKNISEKKHTKQEKVPYKRIFKWAWHIVSVALGWFMVSLFLTMSVDVLSQYNVQVLATVISKLTYSSGTASGVQGTAAGGFLTGLLPKDAQTAAILFGSLSLLIILLRLMNRLLYSWSDNIMVGRLQHEIHDKLLKLGPSYHQKHDVGETMSITIRFSAGTQMMLRELISFPFLRGIGLITALIFLANNISTVGNTPIELRIGLLAAIFILPMGGWWLSRKVRAAFALVRDSETAMINEFNNSAALPYEVQLMGAQKQRSESFEKRIKSYIKHKIAANLRNELATQFQSTIPLLLQAIFLIYGVYYALKSGNPQSTGAILAIYYFVPEAVRPLQEIIQFITGLNSTWPQVEKVVEILEAEPDVTERKDAKDYPPGDSSIQLKDISFSYSPDGNKIIDNLSYTFMQGKVTSIVSRAGMGKSTILNFIVRIRDPQKGVLRIGNQDIRDIKLSSLRQHVVKVSQFPLFIADTVRANFKLVRADASDADIEAVCRKTGLWDVLKNAAGSLDNPLDYVLPRATSEGLSGGQRRLLSVTRAFLLNPSVLLLDEPTTGIDAIGRYQLAYVLKEICKGMTVILVDHDIEFVSQFSDEICCLENGKFVDVGDPKTLSEKPGLFHELLMAAKEADQNNTVKS